MLCMAMRMKRMDTDTQKLHFFKKNCILNILNNFDYFSKCFFAIWNRIWQHQQTTDIFFHLNICFLKKKFSYEIVSSNIAPIFSILFWLKLFSSRFVSLFFISSSFTWCSLLFWIFFGFWPFANSLTDLPTIWPFDQIAITPHTIVFSTEYIHQTL